MRAIRSFLDAPLALGQRLALPEATSNHLVRVLRLEIGDACVLFNGDGHDYQARILGLQKRGAEVEITGRIEVKNESPLRITLAQGIARGEKMDLILQKATELGVAVIAPVVTDRTEVKLDAERSDKKLNHWRGVIAAACEQCGRARLPEILLPQTLDRFAAGDRNARRFILDPAGKLSLPEAGLNEDTLTLAIGPEGGFSERDIATLKVAGYEGLRMGPRILRTETAGMAAIAALNALYGDWR
jgi:16S rRNA (uracil1498-N3)-methyltransferase